MGLKNTRRINPINIIFILKFHKSLEVTREGYISLVKVTWYFISKTKFFGFRSETCPGREKKSKTCVYTKSVALKHISDTKTGVSSRTALLRKNKQTNKKQHYVTEREVWAGSK